MTAPKTWTTGEIVTAAMLNAEVRDRFNAEIARRLFTPATYPGGAATMFEIQGIPAVYIATTGTGSVSFVVPPDFASLVSAKLVLIVGSTQAAANWDLATSYGAVGEDCNQHTGADSATTYNVTNNKWYEIDVTALLSSLAVGDRGGVRLSVGTNGHAVYVVGLLLEYMATPGV